MGAPDRQVRRLSTPVGLIKERYDVVVVGSGYGGAIAASRMARAGYPPSAACPSPEAPTMVPSASAGARWW
jgi:succinate dehydrogenase/fumarate reductase flavoprotein subunit